ncbi:hypothetical protein GGI04_000617 [Coemansia thaxteri]|uniref:Uncharacterized protein n=1 Tax=Coemansia thaxteri TaxID=2663907 RepID=A0A9W8B9Q2_9FUNG|nr:hypothetical protein H4R26_005151 [Coemansia thaxteri]KAJ2009237.1 hypothetical protein GGI04_000617 [Coemansia thaxteri]KAJ2474175.1 hypothetical protein GGI02_000302 [Coemansia sp. RSA 2322]KAJ2479908.1 hypothetical protein EV174_003884 [Coemansia sp. RSA 2320]
MFCFGAAATGLVAWLVAGGAASVGAQQTAAARPMNAFTPIRLIQPQNTEQQRAIQSLVQELQKSSPQLFSNVGQPGNQQLALALPVGLGAFNPSVPPALASQAPRPAPAPAPAPAAPSSSLLPTDSAVSTAAATPLPSPPQAALASSALLAPPPPPSPVFTAASAPISFVIDAMFRHTDTDSAMTADPTSLPFGLHFDSTQLGGEAWSSESDRDSSVSTRARRPAHTSKPDGSSSRSGPDIEDELSGLENAAGKGGMSLVGMVAPLLLVVAALV